MTGQPGEPGKPGEPGEPGIGGGGAGGRGGRGGRGGTGAGHGHSVPNLVIIFFGALAVSLLVFITYNQQLHNRTRKAEYLACLNDRQIAINQRRVILAVIALSQRETEEGHPQVAFRDVEKALADVPQFECKP